MNNRKRIITPGGPMGQQIQYSDEEIMMMKYQGLSGWWAQYAELLRRSDLDDREELAAAASSRAAELLKRVIDAAEKQLEKMEGEPNASQ